MALKNKQLITCVLFRSGDGKGIFEAVFPFADSSIDFYADVNLLL